MLLLAKKIAVVDDDSAMGLLVQDILESEGFAVKTYTSAKDALKDFSSDLPNLLITDLKMNEMNGMELLKEVSQKHPSVVTIMMTAFGSIETAIEAMKNGAYHYLVKPFKNDELLLVAQRGLERAALKQENFLLRSELKRGQELESIMGRSSNMLSLFELVRKISQATANVLITGESGSGRTLVAQAIHNCSPRSGEPFVTVDCSGKSHEALEKELFEDSDSAVLRAHQGTLFLKEVDSLPPQTQGQVLTLLQEKVFCPPGTTDTLPVNIRVISSTQKDLATLAKEGRFREDLAYKLNVIPVLVPPLRERKEDIPVLANHFLHKFAVANQSTVKSISPTALATLISHPWPGNVRELENIIERAVVLSHNDVIEPNDILGIALDKAQEDMDQLFVDRPSLEKLEERYIKLILGEANNQKEKASKILGISRRTLYRKERTYGLVSDDTAEPTED